MLHSSPITLRGVLAATASILSLCILPGAAAQHVQDSEAREEVKVSPADVAAAHEAGPGRLHALAAHTPGAREKLEAIHRERMNSAIKPVAQAQEDAITSNALTGPFFYPGDLASGGGPTLATTRMHAIYVNATGSIASNWGNPEGFLRDLNESTFIHLVDQYTGATEDDRYPVGRHARVHYGTPGATLSELDIAAIVHAVAEERGTGLDNIYHVFLPMGTDTCAIVPAGSPPACYSPDNPATFAFCGYHSAVEFSDIGIVLFTVEPWQGPGSGCEIATATPNGVLIDSTDNVLSHETFETITDPIPGLGYFNLTGDILTGQEIGDECVLFNFFTNSPGQYTPPVFAINGKNYAVQLEYSNTYHACASVP